MAGTDSISTLYSATGPDITAGASLVGALKGKAKMTPEQIDATSKDFESMFVSQMLEQMYSGDSTGEEAFGSSDTNDVYKSLLMDQYGKIIARSGGIGIASYVKQELLKQQEVGS